MIIFVLASIPVLLTFLLLAGMLTYIIRGTGAPLWLCAVYFTICTVCMLHDKITTDIPVGKTVYAVIGVSQDAY